jgi:hypothetical protein
LIAHDGFCSQRQSPTTLHILASFPLSISVSPILSSPFHNSPAVFLLPSLCITCVARLYPRTQVPRELTRVSHITTLASMAPNPSSTCATNGSVTGYLVSCFSFHLQGETSFLPPHFVTDAALSRSLPPKSSTSTAADQLNLVAHRIGDYITNLEHSHVQHRHASKQQAVRTHTDAMASYLEAFDEVMGQPET